MIIPLGGRLPVPSCDLPGRSGSGPLHVSPIRSCSVRGLPSRRGHPRRWCALTAPFHPYRPPLGVPPLVEEAGQGSAGGLLSVALSVASTRLAISQRTALRGSDLPPRSPRRARMACRAEGRRGASSITWITEGNVAETSAPLSSIPNSSEAERSVLGAVLVDNLLLNRVLPIITHEDFYRESHRRIFRAM